MTGNDFLNRAQVAALLQLTPKKFQQLRPVLEAQGFPAPALGTRQGERWDPWDITAWRKRKIPPAEGDADTTELDVASVLDRRAEDLAKGRHH